MLDDVCAVGGLVGSSICQQEMQIESERIERGMKQIFDNMNKNE